MSDLLGGVVPAISGGKILICRSDNPNPESGQPSNWGKMRTEKLPSVIRRSMSEFRIIFGIVIVIFASVSFALQMTFIG